MTGRRAGVRISRTTAPDSDSAPRSGKVKDFARTCQRLASEQKIGIGENVMRAALWQLPGGKQLIVFKKDKVLLFDAEGGRVLAEKDLGKSLIAWNENLDAVLVRTTSSTTAYRATSLEVIHEFDPEFATTPQALETQRSGTFFFSKERRLILTTAKGAWMYDYDLRPLGALEGVASVDRVVRATPPGDPVSETAEWIHR